MARKMDAVDIAAQQRAKEQVEVEQAFLKGVTTLRDLIAPSSIEIHSSHFRLGTKYGRTLYIYGYPRSIYTGWLSGLINIDEVLDVSMFIYPIVSSWVWGGGWLASEVGTLDFAGGIVVHTTAGVAAIIVAKLLGPRKGFNKALLHGIRATLR